MTEERPVERELMAAALRRPFLETYYAGTVYGKLHIWTYDRILSNGWLEYAWWDRVSSDILVDMQNNELPWQKYLGSVRTNKDCPDSEPPETCARLWWTAHNYSLETARSRNDRYFRLMPLAIQELSGLMIDGALAWQIDGLRPWRIPAKWMRYFM